MKVLIWGQPGTYTRFHGDHNCPAVRRNENTHDAAYRQVDLDDLPDDVEPCNFECCFPGKTTAAEVKSMHAPTTPRGSAPVSG